MSDSELSVKAATAAGAISGHELDYGVTVAETTALISDLGSFNDSVTGSAAAKANWLSKVQEKDADREDLISILSAIAKKVYEDPSVTPAMIAAAGFAPRATTRQKIVPQQPGKLTATPFSDGTVRLQWKRAANKYTVAFLVEVKDEAGDWSVIFSTTKTSITLSGFKPGQTRWFRIVATKNDMVSLPSNEASIYHAELGGDFLSIAA